jgi:iron complex transport system substrate-binding protein
MSFHTKITALGAAMCLSGAAQAQDVSISSYGGDVSVPANPQIIAVLDIATIDTLNALGVPIAGIPAPQYVDYLDDVAANATVVGSLFEPDFEGLAILNPDLIIAGGRSSAQVEPLSEIAPTIDMTIWGDNHIEQILSRLDSFGVLTGKETEAATLAQAFNVRLTEAQAAVAGKGNALIILTNGGKVSAYGAGSRFGWLHNALNLPEAVAGVDSETHGEAVSFEFIAAANPDWLIVIDRGAAIGQEGEAAGTTLDNPLVAGTTAWTNDQVIYLNSANVYIAGGGYQAMMDTFNTLITGFGGGA